MAWVDLTGNALLCYDLRGNESQGQETRREALQQGPLFWFLVSYPI